MVIHTVKQGDSVYSIAKEYGVSPDKIISDNDLSSPSELAVGQDIVILFPERVHTVAQGETLAGIAALYGTTVQKLFQNNPALKGDGTLYPGQTLVIFNSPAPPLGDISTNGYAYPFIEEETLRRTLPYLTYLSVFTYGIKNNGELIPPEGDERLIALAKEYDAVPLMMLTSLTEQGTFSNELTGRILSSPELSERVIDSAVSVMKEKGYGGIDADFEYISPENAQAYVDFLTRLNEAMGEEYILFASLAPKSGSDMKGLLYEGHDYAGVGAAADRVLLMTYEWGYMYGPPMAVSPINQVRRVIEYGKSVIEPEKIYMGVPNYGYNWKLPFKRGDAAEALSNADAVALAVERNAQIQYDENAEAPFFNYFDSSGGAPVEHEVWFQNARSADAQLRLVNEYGIDGAAVWNIMQYFPSLWLVLASLYNIRKG